MEAKTMTIGELMEQFSGMSNVTRWNILRFLGASPEGMVVTTLSQALQVDDALISHHCAKLASVGLIERTLSGRYSIYKLKPGAIKQVARTILALERTMTDAKDSGRNRPTTENNHHEPVGTGENSTGNNPGPDSSDDRRGSRDGDSPEAERSILLP